MNRRSFLRAAAVATATPALLPSTTFASAPSAPPNASIEKAATAALALQRRDWEQGILAQAFLEAGNHAQVLLLTRAAIVQRAPDGRLGVVVSGGSTDPAMGGAAYAHAARQSGDPLLREAVDSLLLWIRTKAPRTADGILYHLTDAPQMWSDSFSGAPPFLSAMGFHDEALHQIDGLRARLYNPHMRLLAHIWDDRAQRFIDPSFWGGGNGWAAAALARVLRSLPPNRSADRARLAAFARDLLDGCIAHQRPDGLFHNVIDDPSTFVETNLAQMLAYAIYTGMANAWLPSTYRAAADRMRAAAHAKMDKHGFIHGVCGAPNFDRPGISTEAQAFCILMEAAAARAGERT
jgi:unsaturated rhamnogalacturonyl hydrolase